MNRVRSGWATRSGFYMAAIGSAFGLGNLWRFPFVVGSNEGGAFVLLFVLCVLGVGLPVLVGELMLGKLTGQSAVNAIQKTSKDRKSHWLWVGRLSLLASVLIFAYYSVISGWVLYFLMQFLVAPIKGESFDTAVLFKRLMENGHLQLGLTSVHIVLVMTIVAKGVREGIEKWVKVTMPIFFVLLLFLMTKSLSLPGSERAIRFLFYPDFEKLTLTSFVQVLGHTFFTLSVGMGAMVAFGSYLQKETPTPRAGFMVSGLDILISLLAGLVIFPIVFSGTVEAEVGPSLLFETVPLLFSQMGLGNYFGFTFFLCLYTTALVASFGLLEASVSNLVDRYNFQRGRASQIMGVVVFIFAILPSLSSSVLQNVTFQGLSLLKMFDALLINWILPISAAGICLLVGYKLPEKTVRDEFVDERLVDSHQLYGLWRFTLRWLAPFLIFGALVAELFDIKS